MPQKEREKTRPEIDQISVPGGLSEKTLRALMGKGERRWNSLLDETLRAAFIPVLDKEIIPRLKREPINPGTIQTALRITRFYLQDRAGLVPFTASMAGEIQLAIIQYEANKIGLE